MQKLLYTLLMLNCSLALGKTTLDVSVLLEEALANRKHRTETHHRFDITETDKVSATGGPYTCNCAVTDKDQELVTVAVTLLENKNGVSQEVAHPILKVRQGEKGIVRFGEKSKTSTGEAQEKTLEITAFITR